MYTLSQVQTWFSLKQLLFSLYIWMTWRLHQAWIRAMKDWRRSSNPTNGSLWNSWSSKHCLQVDSSEFQWARKWTSMQFVTHAFRGQPWENLHWVQKRNWSMYQGSRRISCWILLHSLSRGFAWLLLLRCLTAWFWMSVSCLLLDRRWWLEGWTQSSWGRGWLWFCSWQRFRVRFRYHWMSHPWEDQVSNSRGFSSRLAWRIELSWKRSNQMFRRELLD